MGLEPTIFRFEVGRRIRWATRPPLLNSNSHVIYFMKSFNSSAISSQFLHKI